MNLFSHILTFLCCMVNIGDEVKVSALLTFIKRTGVGNCNFTCYLLQDDTNTTMIQHTIFWLIVSEFLSCLSMVFNDEVKDQSSLPQPCTK